MSNTMTELRAAYGEIADLRAAMGLLEWDQQTHMPKEGFATRGRVVATLAQIAHERYLSPRFDELVAAAEAEAPPGDDAITLDLLRWERDRERRIPATLVEENSLAVTASYQAWEEARKTKDFAQFAPHLEKVVALRRRFADHYGYDAHPWDALVPGFERGMTAALIKPVFDKVQPRVTALLKAIQSKGPAHDLSFLDQRWDPDAQWAFGMRVLADLGFDLARGRQDRSTHPFTMGMAPTDVRLTTRLKAESLFSALMATAHEGGHGLYEQGFRPEDARTPLGHAPSSAVHESQARLYEYRVAACLPFWRHYAPVLREHFPGQLDNVSAEQLYAAINEVSASFIRVDADEVTYPLHIILRFELELELIAGTLAVRDLPEAWNAKMRAYLGITPPDPVLGCMQDVHWAEALFGYFPSYSLGTMFGAMFMEKMEADHPSLWTDMEAGDFRPVLGWLRRNVHTVGSRMKPLELVRAATGREFTPEPFLHYLEAKYTELYRLGG
ncbi:MAG: carboxypeptidase M32 [Candidatus Sumerlaeia bacterium]|nr:carboxypeptidase M32 [Candidatus Sumerlaeia bacterium]